MRLLFPIFVVLLGSASAASGQGRPTSAPAPPPPPAPGTPQVLFSRSADEDAAKQASANTPGATTATDAERLAPVFTAYDLEVHLAPAGASIAVEARLTLRNGGGEKLSVLPLQLSSSLHMERVSLGGTPLPLSRRLVASDADHTGNLEETAVILPQPLAPGASLTLAAAYSGTIEATTSRLDRLQTPAEVATRSDWDGIGEAFTGLRGFGDVLWYPVSSVPALLGDGVKLFSEMGRQRAVNQDATITIRVTDEFTGAAPTVAVLAGHPVNTGTPQALPTASFPGVLRFALPETRLGFRAPSLIVAERTGSEKGSGGLLQVFSQPAHAPEAQGYMAAANLLDPLLTSWLGTLHREPLALVDLPVDGAQPSEQGQSVLVSMVAAEPQQIAPLLSQVLPHASFRSPRPWLDEGVAALIATLYAEQTQGRRASLERLAASRGALALAEPASPGTGGGQDLLHAQDAILYRGKALAVLWMLRDVAGDKALSAALHAYDPAADTRPDYFEKLLEDACGKDLRWFFDAWVYRDLGLPDLSIANVFSSQSSEADQWIVSVTIANDGYAEAEVPVTVRSAATATTERVRVPGRTKISRRILLAGEPISVEVNDGTVPEVQASLHQRLLR